MNPDEIDIGTPVVGRLITEQFPHWAGLPITEVSSAGTDNAIYRLGEEMAVRLPRRPGPVAALAREQQWLPRLAPLLPLAVPVPLAQGAPGEGFPFPWAVYRWLDGENVADEPDVDLPDAAARLGRFVAALQRIDTAGGPPPTFRAKPVSVLKAAFVQGVVDKDEFDLRVDQTFASRTCAELAAVTARIPAGLAVAKPPTPARAQGEQPVLRPLLVMVAATVVYAGMPVYAALSTVPGSPHVKGLLGLVGFCVYLIVLAKCVGKIVALERSSGQPPRWPAAGAGGRASQRLPSADPGK
jgi:Phosphotransferase enzyme family/Domain of unknown function (DUF1707)